MYSVSDVIIVFFLVHLVFIGLESRKRILEDYVESLQMRYLRKANSLDATAIRTLLQEPNVDPNIDNCEGGALQQILDRSTESEKMLYALRAVLEHKDANPNGVGNHWAPLKIALARGHHEAAQVLLNHPRTKKEIDPAELNCELIAQIPNEVRLSYDPQCMCMIRTAFDNTMDAFSSISKIWDALPIKHLVWPFSLLVELTVKMKAFNEALVNGMYLQHAATLDARGIRSRLLSDDLTANPNVYDCKGGALHRILSRSTESVEMLDSVRAVLEHKDADPNGVGNHWPPLKIALSRGHHEAAQVLLSHPRTKKEIDPAELSCELIEQLPNEVRLSYDPNAPQCMCKMRTTFDIIVGVLHFDLFGSLSNMWDALQNFFTRHWLFDWKTMPLVVLCEAIINRFSGYAKRSAVLVTGYNPGCIAVLLLEDL